MPSKRITFFSLWEWMQLMKRRQYVMIRFILLEDENLSIGKSKESFEVNDMREKVLIMTTLQPSWSGEPLGMV